MLELIVVVSGTSQLLPFPLSHSFFLPYFLLPVRPPVILLFNPFLLGTYHMPGAWGTMLGTGKPNGEQLALHLLKRTKLYNLESRRKTPNNQMISWWGHTLKDTIGAAVEMYIYV